MHACMHTYRYTYIPTYLLPTYVRTLDVHTYIHTHIHTCIHAYVHAQRSILKLAYLLYLHCLGALRRKAWAQGLQRLRAQWVTDAETRSAQLRRGQPLYLRKSVVDFEDIFFVERCVPKGYVTPSNRLSDVKAPQQAYPPYQKLYPQKHATPKPGKRHLGSQ